MGAEESRLGPEEGPVEETAEETAYRFEKIKDYIDLHKANLENEEKEEYSEGAQERARVRDSKKVQASLGEIHKSFEQRQTEAATALSRAAKKAVEREGTEQRTVRFQGGKSKRKSNKRKSNKRKSNKRKYRKINNILKV